MFLASWILGVVIFGLDLFALMKIQHSSLYSRQQKLLQGLLVLVLPVLGAVVVLMMNTLKPDPERAEFPPAPQPNRDAATYAASSIHP